MSIIGRVNGRIIDISVGISTNTPVYPGDPKPEIERVASIDKDGFAVSRISFGSHTGTHIDAPSHIIVDGLTIDRLPLDNLIGPAVLLDFTEKDGAINGSDLDAAYRQFGNTATGTILLLKTMEQYEENSVLESSAFFSFPPYDRTVYLDESAAEWIVENGFIVVGIDNFSVDAHSQTTVHSMLLGKGVFVVECLDLRAVEEGIYFFVCLPLKAVGCDGAPARAILLTYP